MLNPVPTGWSIKSRSYFRFHAPVQIHIRMTIGCTQGGSQAHFRAKASAECRVPACSMALRRSFAVMWHDPGVQHCTASAIYYSLCC